MGQHDENAGWNFWHLSIKFPHPINLDKCKEIPNWLARQDWKLTPRLGAIKCTYRESQTILYKSMSIIMKLGNMLNTLASMKHL